MDASAQTQPAQAGSRQDQTVVLAGIEFLQPRDHIAAYILEGQLGIVVT